MSCGPLESPAQRSCGLKSDAGRKKRWEPNALLSIQTMRRRHPIGRNPVGMAHLANFRARSSAGPGQRQLAPVFRIEAIREQTPIGTRQQLDLSAFTRFPLNACAEERSGG